MKDFLKLEAIKEVLVEMTAEDQLPVDMNQLDIHKVNELADKKLENDEQYKTVCMIEKFKQLTSYDNDDDVIIDFNNLQEQEDKGNGDDSADLYVTIYQPFENMFTVSELLEEIS